RPQILEVDRLGEGAELGLRQCGTEFVDQRLAELSDAAAHLLMAAGVANRRRVEAALGSVDAFPNRVGVGGLVVRQLLQRRPKEDRLAWDPGADVRRIPTDVGGAGKRPGEEDEKKPHARPNYARAPPRVSPTRPRPSQEIIDHFPIEREYNSGMLRRLFLT